MNTFEFLLLGHLVADWLFQNDWMAVGKRQGWLALAGFVHYAIYTIIILLAFWYSNGGQHEFVSLLTIGGVIFLSHWLIDGSNLVQGWMSWVGQRNQTMVRIMVDQTLHLLILGGIALWQVRR